MKRILCMILIIISCFGLSACGQKKAPKELNDDGKLHIVTTIFPYYDFVREIGGNRVEPKLLLKPGTESHAYEPSPQDIISIEKCDLFVCNGGESDAWVDEILSTIEKDEKHIFKGMDETETALFAEEEGDGMQEHIIGKRAADSDDGDEIEYDEHIWTSPVIAKELVRSLASALSEIDPGNASFFNDNAAEYIKKLDDLDSGFKKVVSEGKRKSIVFGDRFPFLYFAKTYGLSYSAAFPGCSSESEPSAKTVAYLLNKVKEEEIPVIFYIEFSNQKIADTICSETSAQKLLFHSCHNLTYGEIENGITYLELMQNNMENLRKALSA